MVRDYGCWGSCAILVWVVAVAWIQIYFGPDFCNMPPCRICFRWGGGVRRKADKIITEPTEGELAKSVDASVKAASDLLGVGISAVTVEQAAQVAKGLDALHAARVSPTGSAGGAGGGGVGGGVVVAGEAVLSAMETRISVGGALVALGRVKARAGANRARKRNVLLDQVDLTAVSKAAATANQKAKMQEAAIVAAKQQYVAYSPQVVQIQQSDYTDLMAEMAKAAAAKDPVYTGSAPQKFKFK